MPTRAGFVESRAEHTEKTYMSSSAFVLLEPLKCRLLLGMVISTFVKRRIKSFGRDIIPSHKHSQRQE